MAAITEHALRSASQRAVARGHVVVAVLFGSRARGAAGRLSDWDVCLVTDGAAGDGIARDRTLEADDPFWEHPRREDLAEELRRRTAAQAGANAREWGPAPIRLADKRLEGAVQRWIAGHEHLARK